MAVVAAMATGITLLWRAKNPDAGAPVGNSTSVTPPAATPNPPTGTMPPTFLDGVHELATRDSVRSILGSTDNLAIISEGSEPGQAVAFDKRTAATVWTFAGDCADVIAGAALVCGSAEKYPSENFSSFHNTLSWVDAKTGQPGGLLDTSSLGDDVFDFVATNHGVLVIGGMDEALVTSTFETPAVMAYFTGPGSPVWTTTVQWIQFGTDIGPAHTFDEGSGLFVWHSVLTTYVVDEQTGYLVYQAKTLGSAQIFDGRLVYVDDDPDSIFPESDSGGIVDVPGGSPVTLKPNGRQGDSWALSLGPGHPDKVMLATSSEHGFEARDPGNQDWSQTLWRSPDQSSPDAWPDVASIGWDGMGTAYAASRDGRVWAFDVNTGKVLWWGNYPSISSLDWRVTISASAGLVGIQVMDMDDEEPPTFTVLRADNGQPVPGIGAEIGSLKDGVLMTSDDNNWAGTVYVPN